MAPRVLLSTTVGWPSAPRIAGAFACVGCEVHALHPRGAIVADSYHLAESHIYDPLRRASSLTAAIEAANPDLIVPLDDRATTHLLKTHAAGEHTDLIARSLGRPQACPDAMSRAGFVAAARAAGVTVPQTWVLESAVDLEEGLVRIGLPAVLKADGLWGGEGVAVVRSREEGRAAFARLSAPLSRLFNLGRAIRRRDAHFLLEALEPAQPKLSLQKFIAGKPATVSFAAWKGQVLATIPLEIVVAEDNGPASVVRLAEGSDMVEAATRLAAHLGLSGLHGLDFIRDGDGRLFALELNPRATQTSHLALGPGHDLMAALAGAASPIPIPSRGAVTQGRSIALFPQEWLRNAASPHLVSAFHDVPWDDPVVLHACVREVGQRLHGRPIERLFEALKPELRGLPIR